MRVQPQRCEADRIGRLQAHATDKAIRSKKKLFRTGKDTGKKVAVIGAGPAGISAACELRMLGHAVDIFEAKAKPSGLCVYGVAPYKLTNEEALDEIAYLQDRFGFTVSTTSRSTVVRTLRNWRKATTRSSSVSGWVLPHRSEFPARISRALSARWSSWKNCG